MTTTKTDRKAAGVAQPETLTVQEVRADWADVLNRVAYTGARVLITRHGKPVAVIVSPADFERLSAA